MKVVMSWTRNFKNHAINLSRKALTVKRCNEDDVEIPLEFPSRMAKTRVGAPDPSFNLYAMLKRVKPLAGRLSTFAMFSIPNRFNWPSI